MAPEPFDIQMMALALEHAHRAATAGEAPVGAVVYRSNELLAQGHNLRELHDDPTAHVELLVIREAARKLGDWRLYDCSLAVTLEPCVMCAGAIVNARVGRLIYGATDPKAGAVESLYQVCSDPRLNHRPVIIGGLMAQECGQVLRDFFRQRRSGKLARE